MKKAAPFTEQPAQANNSPTTSKPQPISAKLAAEILVNQADAIQNIAREFIQQGYDTAQFDLLRRAGHVVNISGLLAEKIKTCGVSS